ncbi:hypothetical protein C8J57DRAFT_227729 [Mycena rebaudengoi]|nr:hypothetical protein C8J57DRAFT_227729 [Mycena rebaudengoi]
MFMRSSHTFGPAWTLTMLLSPWIDTQSNIDMPKNAVSVSVNLAGNTVPVICNTSVSPPFKNHYGSGQTAACPLTWHSAEDIFVVVNFTEVAKIPIYSPYEIVYVTPGMGDPTDIIDYTPQIPLIKGSRLLAVMTWTQREVLSRSPIDVLGIVGRRKTVWINEPLLVQPDPRRQILASILQIRQKAGYTVTKGLQKYMENSTLTGFATVGGF